MIKECRRRGSIEWRAYTTSAPSGPALRIPARGSGRGVVLKVCVPGGCGERAVASERYGDDLW